VIHFPLVSPDVIASLRPLFRVGKDKVARRFDPGTALNRVDREAIAHARRLRAMLNDERLGGTTTQWAETLFVNKQDYSAFNNSSSEGSLLAGYNQQPVIPAFYFDMQKGERRTLMMKAMGVLSTTSTPTIIFQVRLGTTLGSSYLSGASIGVSTTITTASGVSSQAWTLDLLLTCYTPGIGSGNCTISGAGEVRSSAGFGSPFFYPLEPTTPATATWTQTFDASATQYINLSATWGTQSVSNTITCKNLLLLGLN
jgi:hypothetical protein